MPISEKYFVLPILYLYCRSNIAVATHISKNEDNERTSNSVDRDSAKVLGVKSTTNEFIEKGFTSGEGAKRSDSTYISDTRRLTETSDKDIVYSMTK